MCVCLEQQQEEECDCVITWVKKKKKKVGSDLLESRRAEGAPVDFISSSVKAGGRTSHHTHSASSEAFHDAFMNKISPNRRRAKSPFAPALRIDAQKRFQVRDRATSIFSLPESPA